MTSDAISIVRFMFTCAWQLLTCFHLPGTNVTPLAMMFFVASVGVAIKFLVSFFGVGDARKEDIEAINSLGDK